MSTIVDDRARFGDREGGTVHGKCGHGGLVTRVDGKSGLTRVRRVKRVRPRSANRAINKAVRDPLAGLRHALTLDNRKEFASHAAITQQTKLAVYISRLYHS